MVLQASLALSAPFLTLEPIAFVMQQNRALRMLNNRELDVLWTATTYNGLFEMLSMGRFDFFPRSVIEVKAEQQAFKALRLAADQHVLLRYPYALYFFVHKDNARLAALIEEGMTSGSPLNWLD